MSLAKRIQRKRTKGWRKPENAVIVTRGTIWGNPFKVGETFPYEAFSRIDGIYYEAPVLPGVSPGDTFTMTAERAVLYYWAYVDAILAISPHWLELLRGHDLVCWCAENAPHCHADVLLELANMEAV